MQCLVAMRVPSSALSRWKINRIAREVLAVERCYSDYSSITAWILRYYEGSHVSYANTCYKSRTRGPKVHAAVCQNGFSEGSWKCTSNRYPQNVPNRITSNACCNPRMQRSHLLWQTTQWRLCITVIIFIHISALSFHYLTTRTGLLPGV